MHNQDKVLGTGTWILIFLIALSIPVAGIRYYSGIGAISNLSDAFPWGIWISFDLFCRIAFAAGGFIVVMIVDIFGGKTMKPLLRPAILIALLSYGMAGACKLVDLGQYHRIWYMIWSWNFESALLEVGWCVMLYLTVLVLEFFPAVLERFKLTKLLTLIKRVSLILIIAGITLSTMHQSSLGTMLLIMQDKLHPLYHTAMIPILFLFSSAAVGIAMVIFVTSLTMKVFNRPQETAAQGRLAIGIPWALGIYFIIRMADLAYHGRLGLMFEKSTVSYLFLFEMIVGVIIPFFYFLRSGVRRSTWAMFYGSLLVMIGMAINRFTASWFAISFPEHAAYVPHIMELIISAGILSGGILAYYMAVRFLPVINNTH